MEITKKMGLHNSRKAVTLTELLAVIIIAAILAAVAMPHYRNFVEKAKDQEAIATLRTIAGAEFRYYSENNNFFDKNGIIGETEKKILDLQFQTADWDYYIKGDQSMLILVALRTIDRPPGINKGWTINVYPDGVPSDPRPE